MAEAIRAHNSIIHFIFNHLFLALDEMDIVATESFNEQLGLEQMYYNERGLLNTMETSQHEEIISDALEVPEG